MSSLFTKIINREIPADIVYENEKVIAFLDINPVKKGHTLVVPKNEFENIFDGDSVSLCAMMEVAQKVSRALMHTTGAKGVNLHMNNGYEAGQEVPHAHIHIIPRFARGEAFSIVSHEKYEDNERAALAEHIKNTII